MHWRCTNAIPPRLQGFAMDALHGQLPLLVSELHPVPKEHAAKTHDANFSLVTNFRATLVIANTQTSSEDVQTGRDGPVFGGASQIRLVSGRPCNELALTQLRNLL